MFRPDPNKTYRMPPWFGGIDPETTYAYINDCISLDFSFTSDGKWLADFLPEGFELVRPEVSIAFNQLRIDNFLYGGSYNLISVNVPARFRGRQDQLEAQFPLIIWENNTIPILGGREVDGQPKIYADIQDLHFSENTYFTNASYQGNTFLRLQMNNPKPVSQQQLEQAKEAAKNANKFGYRYIPKVGGPGADLIQSTVYPMSMKLTGVWIGEGNFQWTLLPQVYRTQLTNDIDYYNIIKQLATLPVYETKPVSMSAGSLIMKSAESRVLK
ncbi:acetoacetate decarboxylase family protein [Fictibacillus fluitans]|uniref:Acetoacetate decarboxylase family protein n=1 Tax=Fictibacillus fluitans TaxID=3058422 RepID=A0ABT8I044_9BACL|nr:acetoacetate decarboxylase family protein [Fictibacillus sp. NE201]MDN4526409.1 acetoacetate decarboxylase family protein [Fictibacillus sp. NE201]